MELLLILVIAIFVILYRRQNKQNVYKFIITQVGSLYDKYAPFSFKMTRDKVKELGLEYSTKEYTIQVLVFAGGAFLVSYLYFYSILLSIVYVILAITLIPYLTFLRIKRTYSEFLFEQIQVYTTNTIMEFAVTQSFVKALEGVYASGVLEDPILSDVKHMIELAYQNGAIDESINYMNSKYGYNIVRNMHQLFLQVTKEGALDTKETMDNMLLDIDMLVESVYKDRVERKSFHKTFIQYGITLYLLVMLIQYLLGIDSYLVMLENPIVQVLLHGIILINSYFLLSGEKYYNENVGAE